MFKSISSSDIFLSGTVPLSSSFNEINLKRDKKNTLDLSFWFCFGRYHILVGEHFSLSEKPVG